VKNVEYLETIKFESRIYRKDVQKSRVIDKAGNVQIKGNNFSISKELKLLKPNLGFYKTKFLFNLKRIML